MKMFTKNNCHDEWLIQAYLDNELNNNQLIDFKQHLNECTNCQEIVKERELKIRSVLNSLELIDENQSFNQSSALYKKIHLEFPKRVLWGSIAASIVIVIGLSIFYLSNNKTISNNTESCEWVVINGDNFFPELESPNRLYRMMAIEVKELNENGQVNVNYIIKQCKNNN